MKRFLLFCGCLFLAGNVHFAQTTNISSAGSTGTAAASNPTSSGTILNEPSGAGQGTNGLGTLRASTNLLSTNFGTNIINEPSGAFPTNRFGTNRFGTNGVIPPPDPLHPLHPKNINP